MVGGFEMASLQKYIRACFMLFLLCVSESVGMFVPASAQVERGATVENIATASFEQFGVPFTNNTNIATFVVEAAPTPSQIDFFRFAPGAEDAITTQINGSEFSPSGELGGPFVTVGEPVTTNGLVLDLSGDVSLVLADRFLAGELMFVRVIDLGQNVDSTQIETVVITVTTDSGDTITLRLFESGPDTGEFFAYVPSSRDDTPPNDPVLTTPGQTSLTARYIDEFDETEVSVDTALVDPFGRVFDSSTGELLDGVTVTIVDADTGLPADVFGVDGVSRYPSTLVTGSVVTDESGLDYPLEPGEFLFPLMRPGTYRLLVQPVSHSFPSIFPAEAFETLPNSPFEIIEGSFGGEFEVLATGPLNFDVPLDSDGDLLVLKEAAVQTTSVGDFVGYTIRIENRDDVSLPLIVQDNLPRGFRYQANSARLDGERIADPAIAPNGVSLTFTAGIIRPGESRSLTYVSLVSAGAQLGEAVNQAFAVNTLGNQISNRAEAAVFVQEDLLRSRLTIVGQVVENACRPDQKWARDLEDGIGVGGVRLYLETGDYVVTDQDGLYHFENVLPGTHVVQVDEATLPQGYEAVLCEENSRYADSAISKFVDATGGSIWRANFYLQRTGELAADDAPDAFNDVLEHLDYDQAWLDTQEPGIRWAYPDAARTPSSRSVNVGILHGPRDRVLIKLNGVDVPALNFAGVDTSASGEVALSRFHGVDIAHGRNEFSATIVDKDGNPIKELTEEIWFVTDVVEAALVDDQSTLVADGRTYPSIAVRVTDGAGRPVHAGREIKVNVPAPYLLKNTRIFEDEAPISADLANLTSVTVGPDGIAHVELEPTLQTGRIRLLVETADGRQEEIDTFMRPEKREWILVGLADGTLGLEQLDGPGNISADELLNDGRLAFFAKGTVRGDWLLTVAVDTARRRGDADGTLFEGDIDPNAFYTLYGDRTFQDREAESRFPFYVKLEKSTFQLLFGDYDTDLQDTVLGRYARRLSGLKGVYETERVSVSAFAAETNQGFAREELAADGTSGPFVLASAPLLRNSETIFIETRDRFRPDQVLSITNLTRFVDYDIEFETGEIIFRQPIDATDPAFNPNVIVVEYETSSAVERNITAGGRAAGRLFDGRLEVGATYIREEGDNQTPDAVSQLAGVDVTARIGRGTEIHAEYARTKRDSAAEAADGEGDADAILLEAIHRQESFTATAYFRQDDTGFGLGQQSSATVGAQRVGASVSAEIGRATNTADRVGARHFVDGEVYRERNLDNGDERRVVEAALRRDGPLLGASVGVRNVEEDISAAPDGQRRSTLLTGSLRKSFASLGLTVSAAHEQPLGGEEDQSSQFPQRTILGADKTITNRATLNVRHEILDGANASGNNTTVGVTVQPWSGAEARVATDFITQDSGRRLSATVGLDQNIRLTDKWTASVGAARRARISGDETPLDVVPDDALSPLETAPQSPLTLSDSFTSTYAGLGYRADNTVASGRVEIRDSTIGTRYSGILGGARETSETLSFAAAARIEQTLVEQGQDRSRAEARIGASWRPRGEGAIVFNRFDVAFDEVAGQTRSWRVVNNLGVNALVTKRTQLAAFYGIKYSQTDFLGDSFDEVTHLIGGDLRHDITRRFDIGFAGSALISQNGQTDFQYGPNVGVSPAENVWISLGYNFEGFNDRDFEAAEFSRNGPYIKLRIKFDQHTARGLLDRISPRGN